MRISDWSSDVCSSDLSVLRDEPLRQCTPVGSTEDFHSNLCRNRSFRQGDKMDLNLVIAILCPESLNAVVHVWRNVLTACQGGLLFERRGAGPFRYVESLLFKRLFDLVQDHTVRKSVG